MKSSVIVAKHPLHPMLIPFPIGAFALALIGDLAYAGTGNLFWYSFANWTIGIGIIAALLTAVPGLIDYFTVVRGEAKAPATRHMVLNLSIVGLFVVNLAVRYWGHGAVGANHWITLALTIVADAALLYSGWLGGHLVYHHRIGIEERGQTETAGLRVTLSPEEAERAQRR